MELYVGTSGYSYKEWKGTFYPKDLPVQQMLRFYGERFRTVEINSTFYGMPNASVLEGWADAVPADFKFVLKAPRKITHLQGLKDAIDSVSNLLEVAGVLKEHRGTAAVSVAADIEEGRAAAACVSRLATVAAPRGV